MADRGLRALAAVMANAAAGVVGFGGAAVTGFRLPWSVQVAVLAGTFGWILGSLLAQPLVAWLRGRRYGPGARPPTGCASCHRPRPPQAGRPARRPR